VRRADRDPPPLVARMTDYAFGSNPPYALTDTNVGFEVIRADWVRPCRGPVYPQTADANQPLRFDGREGPDPDAYRLAGTEDEALGQRCCRIRSLALSQVRALTLSLQGGAA